jgi:hypothetical protein
VPKRQVVTAASGLRFGVAAAVEKKRETVREGEPSKSREPKRKRKNDPKFVAAARELRDRYLEHLNAGGAALPSYGKYDVSRMLPAVTSDGPSCRGLIQPRLDPPHRTDSRGAIRPCAVQPRRRRRAAARVSIAAPSMADVPGSGTGA